MIRSLYFFFGIIFLFPACGTNQTPEAWLEENTSELKLEDSYDFTAIKEAVGDRKIVAIGESSHGLGEFYRMKSSLIKYLHEEMDFEILAMEGGFGDINLAYTNIDTLSPLQLRNATVFGNFQAEETKLLFEHIKESQNTQKKLIYTGYDSQASSAYLFQTLKPVVKTYNEELSDSLATRLWAYGKSYQKGNEGDSLGYYKYQNIFLETASEVEEILSLHKDEIMANHNFTDFQFNVMQRAARVFQESYNFSYQNRHKGGELRDELMTKNLRWLMDSVYPNKKVIVWAHNAHVEKAGVEGANVKWMGHFLKEQFPDDYYTIGLFAYEGESYQHWTRKSIAFKNNDSTAIEFKMMNTGKEISFLNLKTLKLTKNNDWLSQPVQGFEVEMGGELNFIPTKRFDALITIKTSGIPTY